MKKKLLILIQLILISGFAVGQSADTLVARYIQATGGTEVYDNINKYAIHLQGNESNVPYESDLAVSLTAKKVLKTRTVLSRKFLYQLDGTQANLYIPTGGLNRSNSFQSQKLSDFEKSKLDLELKDGLLPFKDYQTKGYKAKVIGPKTVNKESCILVEFSNGDITRNYCFSSKTNLIVQEDLTYANGEKVIFIYTAYAKLDNGLLYPSDADMTEAGKTRKIVIISKINDIPDSEFAVK